jgi:hypothetical protein
MEWDKEQCMGKDASSKRVFQNPTRPAIISESVLVNAIINYAMLRDQGLQALQSDRYSILGGYRPQWIQRERAQSMNQNGEFRRVY